MSTHLPCFSHSSIFHGVYQRPEEQLLLLFNHLGAHSQPIFTANDVAALDIALGMFDPDDASFLASLDFLFRIMPDKWLSHE